MTRVTKLYQSMLTCATLLTPSELKAAIVRDPLLVSPDTTVIAAIGQMSSVQLQGDTASTADSQLHNLHRSVQASCVLVVEAGQVVGLLTERDVVCLSVQQPSLEGLVMRQVMTYPVVTLHESAFTDLQVALNLLQQHHIRHLPILDPQNRPVGLVTSESLQRALTLQQATLHQQLQAELNTRQQVEAHLRASEQRYAALVAAAPVGVFRTDAVGNCTYVNDRWSEVTGISPEAALGKGWYQALHPDDRDRVIAEWEQAVQENRCCQLEFRFQPADGTVRWVQGQSIPEFAADDAVIGYVGTIVDISDYKRSEAALQNSEAHQRALMSAIPDLIMRINRAGIYLEFVATPNFHVVGNISDMVGTHVSDTLPLELAQQRLKFIQLALQTNSIQIYQQDLSIDDRTQIEEVRVVPYSQDEVLVLVRDITDRKRAEAALQTLVESTAAVTGKDFFSTLAQQLMLALKVQYVLITKRVGDHLQTLAYWKDGEPQAEITFALADAPCCAAAIAEGRFYCPQGLLQRFADYPLIQSLQADSYLGMPLISASGERLGNLCILNNQPMEDIQWAEAFLHIFALRAAAELERQQTSEALEHLNQELEARVEQRTAALSHSEAKLSAIFNQAAVGLDLVTLDGQYLKVNQKLCDILGYSQEELLSKNVQDVSHPEDIDKTEAERQQLYAGEIDSFSVEKRCLRKDGTTVWINLTVSLVYTSTGEPEYSIGIVEDISARKQTEEALRQSEEQFRQLAENIQSVFWMSDAECSKILYVSPAYETIWGRSCESLYASPQSFANAIHPHDRARVSAFLAKQAEGYDEEYRILQPDGTLRWIHDRAFPIHNAQGEVYRLAGIAEDITERKQAKETLNRQIATIEAAIDGIAILNPQGEYTYLNEAHIKLFGYDSAEELIGQPWQILYSAAEISRFESEIFPQLMQTEAWRGEAIATRRDGSTFDEEISLTLTADGKMICVCRDISERKRLDTERQQAEQRLKVQQEFLRRLIDTVPNLIFVKDWEGRFTLVNQATATLYQVMIEDLIGKTDADFNPDLAEVEQFLAVDREVMTTMTTKVVEETVTSASSQQRYFQTIKTPIVSADGRSQEVLGVATDISDRKKIEEQLWQSNEQLATANLELARATRLKDEFLANMSHELRTPLNAILGMTEGLQDGVFGGINASQSKALHTIERSGSHLLELINDILDIAKIESGQLELDFAPTAIAPLCQSSLTFIKQQALKKQIQLEIKLPLNLPYLSIDERRIRQVLINLLNNAVKFTPNRGKVTLQVSRRLLATVPAATAASFQGFLQIAILDTGIGIAPEHLDKLFQPFIQIDSALNRQYQGTGLGLALVKRLVELHGGQVGVTSQVGVGSCFTIDLPYTASEPFPSESETPVDSSPAPPSGQTELPLILLAEDNEANIYTLVSYLEAKGYRLLVANTGQDAIALAQSACPDLILMDVQMPGMDGLTAIQQIRRQPSLATVPIIALTALAMTHDRDRCLAAGANDYLSKPIRLKELLTLIQQLLASSDPC